jgi:hypothetical protein
MEPNAASIVFDIEDQEVIHYQDQDSSLSHLPSRKGCTFLGVQPSLEDSEAYYQVNNDVITPAVN